MKQVKATLSKLRQREASQATLSKSGKVKKVTLVSKVSKVQSGKQGRVRDEMLLDPGEKEFWSSRK